jgi:hypothetical protein
VTELYPQHPWKLWKFVQAPKGFWWDTSNLRQYFEDVSLILGKTKETWERSAAYCLLKFKGPTVITVYGSLENALRTAYPEMLWSFKPTSKGQTYLKEMVEKIFQMLAAGEIRENYKHSDLRHVKSNRPIELDIYVPSLQLAFEYQGPQHFRQIHRGDFKRQTERDDEKMQLCNQFGITLICIPYRWSGLTEDLVATIRHHRPEIQLRPCAKLGNIILPTANNITKRKSCASELFPFMLPTVYKPIMDPTNW